MRQAASVKTDHDRLRQEATTLAGGLADLAQRATVYHHLYAHSGRNHVFPLLAAHGALWARGYFAAGMRLGRVLALRHAATPTRRGQRLAQLSAFADAFREINRQVCVETYTAYHLTRLHGASDEVALCVSPALLDGLLACHGAARAGGRLPAEARMALFRAVFLWEQECIVGPAVDRAMAAFDWPLVRALAMRPRIAFAYIARTRQFRFRDFASKAERIERGLQAYALAEQAGWARTEAALDDYGILPMALFSDAAAHFHRLRASVLGDGRASVAISGS